MVSRYRAAESPGPRARPASSPTTAEMTAKRDQSVRAGAGERTPRGTRTRAPSASIARPQNSVRGAKAVQSVLIRGVVSSLLRTLARRSLQACGRVAARHAPAHATTPHRTRHTGRRRHSESSPSTEMRTGASLAPRRHYGGMCTCDTSTTVPPQLWIDVM